MFDSKNSYYTALRESQAEWHTAEHDPWPWTGYLLQNRCGLAASGFLLELLAGPAAAAPLLMLRGTSNRYVALSPFAAGDGPTDATWRVFVNVDPDVLLAHRGSG